MDWAFKYPFMTFILLAILFDSIGGWFQISNIKKDKEED